MHATRSAISSALVLFCGVMLSLPAVAASPQRSAAGEEVDLELVLAVDVSRSMDFEEQRIQREGYVEAFRHPDIIKAIESGAVGKIAVTYVEWSGPSAQNVVASWTVIDGAASANAFADFLAKQAVSRWNGTSISGAIDFSSGLFGTGGFAGTRQVIDISGDGPNNMGMPVVPTRDAAVAKGITINGLPMVLKSRTFMDGFSIPNLDAYYRDCVIGGTGAFMIVVDDINQFSSAIRRKLVLEIADRGGDLLPVVKAAGTAPTDCMIGEKQRGWVP